MIRKFEITGVHTDMDEKIKEYVTKSVAKIEHYIPRHARESAHADVKLRESKAQNDQKFTAEMILHLPHEVITAKASTVSMFAAVDIIEEKLKNQIKKYKETHGNPRLHRRLTNRLRRRTS